MTTAADDTAAETAFEALLAGRPAPDGAAGLAAFTEAVRATATSPGRPNAALAELLATGLLTDQSSPSTRAARSAGTPPSRESRVRNRRRFAMFFPALLAKFLSAGAIAQAATGAGVVLVAFTGAGAAGVLPGSVQDTFATVVSDVTPFEAPTSDGDPVTDEPVVEPLESEEVVDEAPVLDEPAVGETDEQTSYDVVADWMAAPIDGTFGAWVTSARHDPEIRAAIEDSGHPVGYYVSLRAHQKGMTPEDLAAEGVDLEELSEDSTVVVDSPEGEVADTEQPTHERGNGNGNGRGNGNNGGGNGNGNGNGRN